MTASNASGVRRIGRSLAACLVLVVCASCVGGGGGSGGSVDSTLFPILLDHVLPGFVLNADASGGLDLDAAAAASPAESRATRDALDSSGFAGGAARVWTMDDSFVSIVVDSFDHPVDAARFAQTLVGLLRAAKVVYVSPMDKVPAGWTYTLTGSTKAKMKPVFCEGAVFPVGTWVFDVRTCDPFPNSIERARQLGKQQYDRARSSASTSPTPTPGESK